MIDGTEEFVDDGKKISKDMLKVTPGVETFSKMPKLCSCATKVVKVLNVKFKKLHDDAVLPRYAKDGDAGMDCYAVGQQIVKKTYVAYKLGFAVEIPEGYVGLMFPRSSISKKDLMLTNSVGVIDSGYRGEVEARFKPTYMSPLTNQMEATIKGSYAKGDAVCQLIVIPYPQVSTMWADELSETDRGEGGFGSTTPIE